MNTNDKKKGGAATPPDLSMEDISTSIILGIDFPLSRKISPLKALIPENNQPSVLSVLNSPEGLDEGVTLRGRAEGISFVDSDPEPGPELRIDDHPGESPLSEKETPLGREGSDTVSPETVFIQSNINKCTKLRQEYENKRTSCGKKVVKLVCQDCGMEYWVKIGCGLRTCPACARLFRRKVTRELWQVAKNLEESIVYKFRHITFGYGIDGDRRTVIKKCKKIFKKIWRNILDKRNAGAIATVEFGPERGSIHLHCLYFGPYVTRERLQREWKRLTIDKWYVDIRQVQGRKAVNEVCKYIVKPASTSVDPFEIEQALKGLRRLMTYGCFYNRLGKSESVKCFKCGGYLDYEGIYGFEEVKEEMALWKIERRYYQKQGQPP